MDPHQDHDLVAPILNVLTAGVSSFGLVHLAKDLGTCGSFFLEENGERMVLTSLCVTECVFFCTKPWSQSASRTVHLNWWATLTQGQCNELCGQFCAMVSNITLPAIKVLFWFPSKFHMYLSWFWLWENRCYLLVLYAPQTAISTLN